MAQVSSGEFCKISKNAFFFTEHFWWLLLKKLNRRYLTGFYIQLCGQLSHYQPSWGWLTNQTVQTLLVTNKLIPSPPGSVRNSHSQMFFKIGVLKNIRQIYLCCKVAGLQACNFVKKDALTHVFSLFNRTSSVTASLAYCAYCW